MAVAACADGDLDESGEVLLGVGGSHYPHRRIHFLQAKELEERQRG
jgi:hypothetical protein